jgi:hypothetical protein
LTVILERAHNSRVAQPISLPEKTISGKKTDAYVMGAFFHSSAALRTR